MLKNEVEVSVICITYNHKDFLANCLDHVISQKTNFKFEILVHDDCSTDGTTQIVKDYAQKYPNLIVPIYEEKNQYSSKDVKIIDDIILPKAKGKYIALCEGDDYWCDDNKLQLQYDFMEAHPDFSACFHNTKWFNLVTKKSRLANNWKKLHYLSAEDVIMHGKVHTSSYFVRKESFGRYKFAREFWAGDYALITYFLVQGKLASIPRVMSVYNENNPSGAISVIRNMDINLRLKKENEFIEYLNRFNDETDFAYYDIIKKKIKALELCLKKIEFNYYIKQKIYEIYDNNDKHQYNQLKKNIKLHPCYADLAQVLFKWRVKVNVFCRLPFWLWKIFIKKKYNLWKLTK